MPKKSAGLLLYRRHDDKPQWELLLVHPGGPFWRKKDDGAWTIPKGEFDDSENPLDAARREFKEELGADPPAADPIKLKPVKQAGGKIVHCWAVAGEFDPTTLHSNTFQQEWPPKSGQMREFPEVDRAAWYSPEMAKQKIIGGQLPLIDELMTMLGDAER